MERMTTSSAVLLGLLFLRVSPVQAAEAQEKKTDEQFVAGVLKDAKATIDNKRTAPKCSAPIQAARQYFDVEITLERFIKAGWTEELAEEFKSEVDPGRSLVVFRLQKADGNSNEVVAEVTCQKATAGLKCDVHLLFPGYPDMSSGRRAMDDHHEIHE